MKRGDLALLCPECGSPHFFALRKVFSAVVRGDKHVVEDTGGEWVCISPKCGYHFATTERGVVRLAQPSRVEYQHSTEAKPPEPRTKAEQWTPKVPPRA